MQPGSTIGNVQRGCGHLKAGGYYAHAAMVENGTLHPWTATWGSGHLAPDSIDSRGRPENFNIFVSQVARAMSVINLSATLYEGKRVEGEHKFDYELTPALNTIPNMAISDHVGGVYYTAYSFLAETATRGPSRRIPKDLAVQLAPFMPMPIAFTHNQIPVAKTNETRQALFDWALEIVGKRVSGFNWFAPDKWFRWSSLEVSLPEDVEDFWSPAHYKDIWGPGGGASAKINQWMMPVLQAIDIVAEGNGKKKLSSIFPAELSEETYQMEQLYGFSWLTDILYVMGDDEDLDDSKNNKHVAEGIIPVRADDPT